MPSDLPTASSTSWNRNSFANPSATCWKAARPNAVENFCKGFDPGFGDGAPDKANTGIAFLIGCDMLLTGFDAPIEQVIQGAAGGIAGR